MEWSYKIGSIHRIPLKLHRTFLIEADADAFGALKLMSTNNESRLIVMDNGQMGGIISRTDLMRAIQFRGAY